MSIPSYPKEKPLSLIESAFYPNVDEVELRNLKPGSALEEDRADYEYRQSTITSLKTVTEDKTPDPPKLKKKRKPKSSAEYFKAPTEGMKAKKKRLFR